VPAIFIWALLGLLLNLLPLRGVALALIVAYGAYYGLVEAGGRPGLAPPGRKWQVPAPWVGNVPRFWRTAVWGSLLGPGFATRNPYAGFGLLPLAVAAAGDVRAGAALGAAVGLLHSTGRALALLRDVRDLSSADYLQSVLLSLRWRIFDGMALLAVTGVAVMTIVLRMR
jgi:hypothetical protein